MKKEDIVKSFEKISIEGLDITPQVLNVISKIDNFPLEEFKKWLLVKKLVVTGMMLFEFLDKEMK